MTRNADRDQLCFSTQQLITEYEQARDPDSTEISQQFAQLHRMMMQQKDVHSSIEGAKPINIRKNRYKDVLPYDEYRVTLETVNNSDYINASYIEDFYGKRRYIAAQGPIYETVEDFFRMIWELQVCSIVCTANDTEAGRSKFHRYWPDDQKSLNIGAYKVTLDETDDRMFVGDYFHVRPLIISQGTNRRHVLLYHFLYWHDHDVPSSEKPIFDLLNRVDQDRSSSPDTPILVHCSAGCGRTGSLIAIDLCRLILHDETLLFNEKYRQYPIYNIAAHIRQYRIALVQTVKKYLFVHKMFVFLMKSTGHVTSLATTNYEDNYSANIKSSPPSIFSNSTRRPSGPFLIKLGNPPTGRRNNNNGTITNDTYSSNNSSSDYYSLSSNASTINSTSQSSPPPIPPRTFLNNSTNKVSQNRFVHHIELPMKLKSNLRRSRPVQRREATPRNNTDEVQTARADSADPLLTTFAKVDQSLQDRRKGILIDGGANSD